MTDKYLATFLVKNVGRSMGELQLVYLCGGCAALLTMNVVGRLADRFDKLLVFRVLALLTVKLDGNFVFISFAGGAEIRLEVDRFTCHLEDLGEPWPTVWRPQHSTP